MKKPIFVESMNKRQTQKRSLRAAKTGFKDLVSAAEDFWVWHRHLPQSYWIYSDKMYRLQGQRYEIEDKWLSCADTNANFVVSHDCRYIDKFKVD